MSEATAVISACNKANVAIYPIDVRGLVAGTPQARLSCAGWSERSLCSRVLYSRWHGVLHAATQRRRRHGRRGRRAGGGRRHDGWRCAGGGTGRRPRSDVRAHGRNAGRGARRRHGHVDHEPVWSQLALHESERSIAPDHSENARQHQHQSEHHVHAGAGHGWFRHSRNQRFDRGDGKNREGTG